MVQLQEQLNDVVGHDPGGRVLSPLRSAREPAGQQGNDGRMYINLKPWNQRPNDRDHEGDRAAVAKGAGDTGRAAVHAAGAGHQCRRPAVADHCTNTRLQDADRDELNNWAPKMLAADAERCRMLRDVATDQQIAGTTATLTIDRDAAQRFGIQPQQIDDTLYDAFGQREVTQYFTQLKLYYVILEVPPQTRGRLATLRQAVRALAQRARRCRCRRLVTHRYQPGHAAGDQPSEPVPGGDDLVQPRAGRLARRCGERDPPDACATCGAPLSLQGSFQGTAQAFQSSLASEPYLIAAALIAVYIILGILYESYILPLTILSTLPSAGVGALLMLMLAHTDLSVIAMIGIILLIGIVKKNGIMMVDFAIHAERTRGHGAAGGHPPGLSAALPPDPDDDDGGVAQRPAADAGKRRGIGTAQAAGLRHGRRAAASQVLTLYTTPVIYLYLDRVQRLLFPERATRLPRLAGQLGGSAAD